MLIEKYRAFATPMKVSMEIPALDNPDVYARYCRWAQGEGLIQVVLPELSLDEREFLISGLLPEEWDKLMKDS